MSIFVLPNGGHAIRMVLFSEEEIASFAADHSAIYFFARLESMED